VGALQRTLVFCRPDAFSRWMEKYTRGQ
jgi:hypothetical protein